MKHRGAKRMNIRHGHGPRRGCNAVEKAIETATRQAGKREALTQSEVLQADGRPRGHGGGCRCPECVTARR